MQSHVEFLQSKAGIRDFFLVGGCVRDLLLGIKTDLVDIDFTMAGNPLDLYEKMEKEDFSHFITEKFGTITLISKSEEMQGVKYELTPFREET